MDRINMGLEVTLDIEASPTSRSVLVLVITDEWFPLSLVNYRDMLLECIVLPKFLPTRSKSTGEQLSLDMLLTMPFQSCPSNETFATALPFADIIPLI